MPTRRRPHPPSRPPRRRPKRKRPPPSNRRRSSLRKSRRRRNSRPPKRRQSPRPKRAAPAEAEPTEEAAAETEPDAGQPAPPIPQGGIRIVFPTELNEVPSEANAALDDLAAQMQADESMRIQIMCYASGNEETESKARRKSLARCINIRQYLFKKDVRTTRMDVRALGLKSEGQPADRVDIVPATS